jgi:hypothetical protein
MRSHVSNVFLHPRAEALAILAALRSLQLFSQAKVHLTTEDSDLSGMRGWQAADAIIAHAIDVLCHRTGLQSCRIYPVVPL